MKAPDDQDSILARYMDGPAILERALAGIRDEELDARPARGGWTIREIVHHIVDGDDLWKTCVKMALGNEQAVFSLEWYQGQAQEVWATKWAYENRSIDVPLALLKANRNHIRQILEQVAEGWNRSVTFRKFSGETEPMPAGAVIEIQAWHVEHHVKQILAIRSEVGNA